MLWSWPTQKRLTRVLLHLSCIANLVEAQVQLLEHCWLSARAMEKD